VTKFNRSEYIFQVADYYLNRSIRQQCSAFTAGLCEIVQPHWLRLFDVVELRTLLSGSGQAIDLADWEAHTTYEGASANSAVKFAHTI
jgi:ubiquitin-protein ligase E3 C